MPKINIETRKSICEDATSGMSQKAIAKKYNISRSGVQHTLKKFFAGLPLKDMPRSGRPEKITIYDRRCIIRESKKNPFKTANEIRSSLNLNDVICTETVKSVLRKYGLKGRIAAKKPFLTKVNKKKRFQYCNERRHWNNIDWSKYIFSDEVKLSAGFRTRQYVRRPTGDRLNDKYTVKKVKFPTSIMVWGAIRSDGRKVLVRCNGMVDSVEYQRVLEDGLNGLYNTRYVLQQDGAKCHTSASTFSYFERKSIRVVKNWPPQSPDLNIIEGLWNILKDKIQNTAPKNENELFEAAKDAWNEIPDDKINTLYQSLPRRCLSVLKAKGGNTRY